MNILEIFDFHPDQTERKHKNDEENLSPDSIVVAVDDEPVGEELDLLLEAGQLGPRERIHLSHPLKCEQCCSS